MKRFNQKNNTLAFVTELEIVNQLDGLGIEEIEFDSTADDEKLRQTACKMVSKFDWLIQPGEIRLLSQTDRLTYGAILPWDWNHALLIPFSHAENPATDQEMYASDGEIRGLFQQVYQLWNARTVNRSILAKSWIAGTVPKEDMSRLNQMLQHIWLGEKLDVELQNRTGLPLLEGKDIRKKYLDEELANFAKLDLADAEAEWAMNELESEPLILRFEELKAEVELQAAAGRNMLSEAYVLTPDGLKFLQGIELTDFEKIRAGKPLPHFCWSAENLPGLGSGFYQVLFRHRQTGKILGTGPVLNQPFGFEIILANPIDPEDVPELSAPADIQLIFCK